MAPPFMQLPAYQAGNALNFNPLSQGIDDLAAGIKQGRANALNRDIGQRAASGDWKGAAGAAFENGQLDAGMGLTKFKQQQDASASDHERKVAQHMAGVSQMILQAPPEQGRAMWQKMVQAQPNIVQHLTKYGIDPNDHQGAAKFMIAEARGYVNPLEEQTARANLDLVRAKTHSAYRADEPEIVRQMRAGGIDPKSAEGQAMIRNSIKGGSPIDQAIAGAMSNIGAPAQPQPAQQQGQFIPQSAPGNALNPGIQLTAGGAPQSAPAQPSEPMADTPLGPMPASKARILGFGLAYQGKGEAGKMFNEAGNAAKLSKTAEGENDKAEMGLVNQLGRLREMQRSFDPKFLTFQKQGEMWGKSLVDKLGALGPDDQKQLSAYTTFRRDAASNVNRFIKEATGATVGVEEASRLMLESPNAGSGVFDGDSPTQFKTKMDKTVEASLLATARMRYLRAQGFTGKPWEAGIDFGTMEGIIQKRGAEIDQQLREANPRVDPTQLGLQRRHILKKEFGI
jgi:hypothetical protein